MMNLRAPLGLAATVLLALPASSMAADQNATVSGVVGTELSLAAATPGAMTFSPSTDGTASSAVTVTSTQPSWTLSILDQSATTPGHLDKASGVGSLTDPLEFRLSGAGSYSSLSGSAQTVTTGSLVDTKTVDYRQQIEATEDIAAGDAYNAVVTYRVQ